MRGEVSAKLAKMRGLSVGSGGRFSRPFVVIVLACAALAAVALALPAGAGAHAERPTFFPDPDQGAFPEYRTTGPALVVCAADTKQRSSASTARSGRRSSAS